MFKYLFGPVPSRRLGMSLGVDLVPRKVCTLDCIYCEVGKTTKLCLDRQEYIPYDKLTEELEKYFLSEADPDYFTFSGSGEPTLNSSLGRVIEFIRAKKPGIPIAVLTNGTLFSDPEVRSQVAQADLVLPSLDAVSDSTFGRINRPVKKISVEEHITGLETFREEFSGEIWLEIMIIPGYNDHLEELKGFKKAIQRIKPDQVQINTLDRPGTVENIRSASKNELQQIIKLWALPNVKIISASANRKQLKTYHKDIEGAILETIKRRPCTLDDLSQFLGLHISEINKYLDTLEDEGEIVAQWQDRGVFYQLGDRISD